MNGGKEKGELFEVRKVCFSSDCLNFFATGCSYHYFELGNVHDDYGDDNHDDDVNTRGGPRLIQKGAATENSFKIIKKIHRKRGGRGPRQPLNPLMNTVSAYK